MERTKRFAHDCVKLALKLPNSYLGNHIKGQLIRCSISVAANYRAARLGQSKAVFISKISMDELPQFWNVLKWDMSVVGPRPHRVWLNNDLRDGVDGYMVRHYLNSGITGWAQVNGWRGTMDTKKKKIERTKHDLWYMENWSFFLDIRIIFLTVFGKKALENAF